MSWQFLSLFNQNKSDLVKTEKGAFADALAASHTTLRYELGLL